MGRKILNLGVTPLPDGGAYANPGRQFVFDLIKCISILILPLCHMCEEFVQLETYTEPTVTASLDGFLSGICEFFWGTAGAPVFMFCLGVGIIYSRRSNFRYLSLRSGKTIVFALLLVFFTQTLSLLIQGFMYDSPELINEGLGWLFCCDILNFAGLVFLFFALVIRFRIPNLVVVLIPVVLLVVSMFVPTDICADSIIASGLIGWFFWQNTTFSFFPFCQWLLFPVAGYIFAQYLRNTDNQDLFYKRIMVVSLSFFAVLTVVLLLLGVNLSLFFTTYMGSCYNHSLVSAIWATSFIFFEVGLIYFISKRIPSGTVLHRFATYCSKSLITLYCIQWLIIGFTYRWILPALDMLPLTDLRFILVAAIIYAVLFTITVSYQKIKARVCADCV